jgi:two-component system NarL family sensor kinase
MKALILPLIIFFSYNSLAQDFQLFNKDSLMQVLKHAKEDKDKELLLLNLGFAHQGNIRNVRSLDSAVYYYNLSFALSKKLKDTVGMLNYVAYYANAMNASGKYNESLQMNLWAVSLAEKIDNPRKLAAAYNNTSNAYDYLLDYENELVYTLKALHVVEQTGNKRGEALINGNLCQLYGSLKEYDKSYVTGVKAINIMRALGESSNMEYFLYTTGNALNALHRYDSALLLLKQSLGIATETQDTVFQVTTRAAMGEAYLKTGEFMLVKDNAEIALKLASAANYPRGICQAQMNLAFYYFYNRAYQKARLFIMAAIDVSKKGEVLDVLQEGFSLLADIELALGNTSQYLQARAESDSMQAASLSAEIIKNTQELETKYSLGKKQAEIDNLNKQRRIDELTIRQRNIISWALAIILFVISVIGFLAYRNY